MKVNECMNQVFFELWITICRQDFQIKIRAETGRRSWMKWLIFGPDPRKCRENVEIFLWLDARECMSKPFVFVEQTTHISLNTSNCSRSLPPPLALIWLSQHFHRIPHHAAFYNITKTIVLSKAPQSAGFIQSLWVEGVRNIQEPERGCLAKVTQVALGDGSNLEEALHHHPSSPLLLFCLVF